MTIFVANNLKENENIIQYAMSRNISCVIGEPTIDDIQKLEEANVDCLISIEYPYLIPLPSSNIYTLNMHPTLLPNGRGATPLNYLILKYPQYAGITFHKLANKFDEGDIVFQVPLELNENESLESLFVTLNEKVPLLLNKVLNDLPRLYLDAIKQGEGSYWPKLQDDDRIINWHDDIKSIDLMVRAFGRFGVFACVGDKAYLLNHVELVELEHAYVLGDQLSNSTDIFTVAVKGGIAIVYKNSILDCVSIKVTS